MNSSQQLHWEHRTSVRLTNFINNIAASSFVKTGADGVVEPYSEIVVEVDLVRAVNCSKMGSIWAWSASRRTDLDNNLSSCLLYTSPSPRDRTRSRMPSSA
eukprot:TRINITY_DN11057_c0_g2_i1.p1 TRINITY_DN11057_c0_g2~~TRINITY_DN11057_c0_g2_i1.p1  ORF type:complete len:101 (-),score=9.88 TRINITY_DN11057_c0_g2_i1:52-354(-)